jgi:hypothetical protein
MNLWSVVAFLVLSLTGCGPSVGTVRGKVVYQGKNLKSGLVVFMGADGKVSPPASIGADGTYAAVNVPLGTAKIAIDTPPPPPAERPEDEANAKSALADHVSIPLRYKDFNLSGKICEVKWGENTCDIELE